MSEGEEGCYQTGENDTFIKMKRERSGYDDLSSKEEIGRLQTQIYISGRL